MNHTSTWAFEYVLESLDLCLYSLQNDSACTDLEGGVRTPPGILAKMWLSDS